MNLSKMTKKIVVSGKQVELQYILYTATDEEIVIQSRLYDQELIDREVAIAEAKKTALDVLDIDAEKVKEDVKLAELGLIQTEMDKIKK